MTVAAAAYERCVISLGGRDKGSASPSCGCVMYCKLRMKSKSLTFPFKKSFSKNHIVSFYIPDKLSKTLCFALSSDASGTRDTSMSRIADSTSAS